MARASWRVRGRAAPAEAESGSESGSLRDDEDVRSAYDLYGGELFGFVFKALGDRQQSEDVVQEVFIRAWRSFDPSKGQVRTWLFAIARNAVADVLRRRADRGTVELDHSHEDGRMRDEAEADSLDRLLERIQLDEALGRLSPEHRQAVIRVYFGGQTCAELGKELGIPASTMRSRLYYGVRTLRLVLEERGWLAP